MRASRWRMTGDVDDGGRGGGDMRSGWEERGRGGERLRGRGFGSPLQDTQDSRYSFSLHATGSERRAVRQGSEQSLHVHVLGGVVTEDRGGEQPSHPVSSRPSNTRLVPSEYLSLSLTADRSGTGNVGATKEITYRKRPGRESKPGPEYALFVYHLG